MSIVSAIANKTARTAVKLKAASPHILFVVGLVGLVAGTVVACKQTKKFDEDLKKIEEAKDILEETRKALESGEIKPTKDISIEIINENLKKLKHEMYKAAMKRYALAVAIIVVSGAAATGGHCILTHQRNKAIEFGNATLAMYNGAVASARDRWGDEHTKQFLEGEENRADDAPFVSKYDIYFDQTSSRWSPIPTENYNFIISTLSSFEHQFNERGFVQFADIWQALGHSKREAIARFGDDGRVKDLPDGTTGTFDISQILDSLDRDFVKGYESTTIFRLIPHGSVSDLIRRFDRAKRSGRWEPLGNYNASDIFWERMYETDEEEYEECDNVVKTVATRKKG